MQKLRVKVHSQPQQQARGRCSIKELVLSAVQHTDMDCYPPCHPYNMVITRQRASIHCINVGANAPENFLGGKCFARDMGEVNIVLHERH